MRYQITEHADYVRAVIGDGADASEFARFYSELQSLCALRGFDRALVVVRPEGAVPVSYTHLTLPTIYSV